MLFQRGFRKRAIFICMHLTAKPRCGMLLLNWSVTTFVLKCGSIFCSSITHRGFTHGFYLLQSVL